MKNKTDQRKMDTIRKIDEVAAECFAYKSRAHLKKWEGNTCEFRFLTVQNALACKIILESKDGSCIEFENTDAMAEAGWRLD